MITASWTISSAKIRSEGDVDGVIVDGVTTGKKTPMYYSSRSKKQGEHPSTQVVDPHILSRIASDSVALICYSE